MSAKDFQFTSREARDQRPRPPGRSSLLERIIDAEWGLGYKGAMLANAIASALLNVVLLAGIPFLVYYLWHRLKHGRRLPEVARRAGLQVGDPKYIA